MSTHVTADRRRGHRGGNRRGRRSVPLLAVLVAGLSGAGFVAVLPAVAAGAAPATATPAISINPPSGPPLTTIKVTGSGFCGTCGPVSIQIGSLFVAGGVAVTGSGTFSTFVRVPGTVRPGPVDVAASQSGGGSARTTFNVTINQPPATVYPPPSTVPPPGGLPPGSATPAGSGSGAHPTGTGTAGATPAGTLPAGTDPAARSGPVDAAATGNAGHVATVLAWLVPVLLVAAAACGFGVWWLRRHGATR